MRDYAKVAPSFWIGETGKSLRGDMEAQIVALYLMTSPHATMTGVYHCPLLYIAHETGLSMEGASKGLQRLLEGGFCDYEEASEQVFVVRMAAYQVGETLSEKDNRVAGLQRDFDKMPETRMKARFFETYGEAFHLKRSKPLASPLQAPPKPRAGTRAGEETGNRGAAPAGAQSNGSRLPSDWTLPADYRAEALRIAAEAGKRVSPEAEADKFRDYWKAKTGKDATKADWLATWRNWIRRCCERAPAVGVAPTLGDDL